MRAAALEREVDRATGLGDFVLRQRATCRALNHGTRREVEERSMRDAIELVGRIHRDKRALVRAGTIERDNTGRGAGNHDGEVASTRTHYDVLTLAD